MTANFKIYCREYVAVTTEIKLVEWPGNEATFCLLGENIGCLLQKHAAVVCNDQVHVAICTK